MTMNPDPRKNHLLAVLPPEVWQRLAPADLVELDLVSAGTDDALDE